MSIIQIKEVSLGFPGVKALDNVSFDIEKGEIIGLCGENGAGKSTLGKIIAGVWPYGRYSGEILLKGEELRCQTTLDAEKVGIAMAHQELNQLNNMTVADNLFLTSLPTQGGLIDTERLYNQTSDFLHEVGLEIEPDTMLSDLSVGYRQLIEIAKVISKNPEIIIFDESTSALSENEVDILFKIMKKQQEKQVTMIYVSHKLDEIFHCCTDVVILKDGCFVGKKKTNETNKNELISMMIGRELTQMYPKKPELIPPTENTLEVKNWFLKDQYTGRYLVNDCSFSARPQEILGFYGLVGAGRTEMMRSIFEGHQSHGEGTVLIDGKKVKIKDPADAISKGLIYLSDDRKKDGLILDQSIEHNLVLPSLYEYVRQLGWLDREAQNEAVDKSIDSLSIKIASKTAEVSNLSGGNQQKVCIGKSLLTKPRIFILDEPTVGIDVGTKSEIYNILRDLATSGMTVIVISSDIIEIIGICDRVVVMNEGQIKGELVTDDLTEDTIMQSAIGDGISKD